MNHGSVSFLIREILNTDPHSVNAVNEYISAGMLHFKSMVVVTYFSEHTHNNELIFSLNIKMLLMKSQIGNK